GDVQVANLKPAFETLLQQFDPQALDRDLDPPAPRRPAVEEIGVITAGMGGDLRQQIVFIGETAAALVYAVLHPSTIRWKDVWHLRARWRRRAADRRTDFVPARRDPRVPVGNPDAQVRRR